ncbi:MAG TPA: hypothetical protein VKR57_09565 [Terriglobales bacterium]|nr:hypothetical protein [Terriglobales bacterium]
MRRLVAVVAICWICVLVAPACAQQIDVAFAGGSLSSPGNSFSAGTLLPAEGGGAFVGFNGDVLFKGNLGAQIEVNWRASQGLYGGQLPYRPLFYDFNAIYARRFTKLVGAEALAGIGAESIRFYQGTYNCDFYGNCSNYVSSTHFMGDFGGGIRFYPYKSFFVRPEMRLYLVHNNVEFSSARLVRYGVSIGYTFGGSK